MLKDIKKYKITKCIVYMFIISCIGFPRLLTYGFLENKKLNYMVLTKYDADLELMFNAYNRKFRLSTVINIGLIMIDILEKLHSIGYLHIDLKPQNIMTKYG